MNGSKKSEKMDMKIVLSFMWIFAMFNYLYADVMTVMDPESLRMILSGSTGVDMNPAFLLGAAILARILPYSINRVLNIIVGIIHTGAVGASLFVGAPALYYMFFAVIEITCTILIIIFAIMWKNPKETA